MARIPIGNVYPSDEYLLARCAPAGYGLGGAAIKTISSAAELDTATRNGWYRYDCVGSLICNVPFNYASLYVLNRAEDSGVWQELRPANTTATRIVRTMHDDGTWGEWEVENPPVETGVEYRTTERYMGKPVYVRLVDCDGCPGAESKTIAHNEAGVVDKVISAQGQLNHNRVFPSSVIGGSMKLDIETSGTDIILHCTADYLKGAPCFVLLKYTKI